MDIIVKVMPDGRPHVFWPKGEMPSTEEWKQICLMIKKMREEAAA